MNLPLQISELHSYTQPHPKKEGWKALLQLKFEHKTSTMEGKTNSEKTVSGKTVLGKTRHYGPLRVQRPFYPEGGLAHIYILHPPGGVVGGDILNIDFTLEKNSQVLSTTPGSGKFYLSAGDWAKLQQNLLIKPGACLEWLPQENILFSGARVQARTRIDCRGDGKFIGWDISCLGRPSIGETFTEGAFDSRLEFYHNDTLLFIENQRVFNNKDLHASAGLRSNPLQASLLAFPCTTEHLETVRKKIETHTSELFAATLVDGLLIVRALGNNSEQIKQQLTQVWQVLRPMLLKRFAVPPRIWAT